MNESYGCAIPATHDKAQEAHYFLGRMMTEYHEPEPFRWNLNAFLQAARSVTLLLQKELAHDEGFAAWYEPIATRLAADDLLSSFNKGRVIVVHKGMLTHASWIKAGVFRGRRLKLIVESKIPPDLDSETALRGVIEAFTGRWVDHDHTAIGEQLGVERRWIVTELGDQEVVELCNTVMARLSVVVQEAHAFRGQEIDAIPEREEMRPPGRVTVLLESDIDPEAVQRWGW